MTEKTVNKLMESWAKNEKDSTPKELKGKNEACLSFEEFDEHVKGSLNLSTEQEKHVSECIYCQKNIEIFSRLVAEQNEPMVEGIKERRMRRYMPLTGLAAAAILVFALFLWRWYPSEFDGTVKPKTPSASEQHRPTYRAVVPKSVDTRGVDKENLRSSEKISFHKLTFRYQNWRDGKIREFDIRIPGDMVSLNSKDNYGFSIKSDQDVCVYIYQLDSRGKLSMLFPNATYSNVQNPLKGGQVYELPSENNWYYLDENKGEERLYVLVSLQPKRDWELYAKEGDTEKGDKFLAQLRQEIAAISAMPDSGMVKWVFSFKHE